MSFLLRRTDRGRVRARARARARARTRNGLRARDGVRVTRVRIRVRVRVRPMSFLLQVMMPSSLYLATYPAHLPYISPPSEGDDAELALSRYISRTSPLYLPSF
jgi:hypothetical protein